MQGQQPAILIDRRQPPRGFTLVEMLVAISVLLVLAVLTLSAVRWSTAGDRIPGGARQVQSYLEGARDRAIHARAPRGVRFILDPNGPLNASNNPKTASSMVFIGAPEKLSDTPGDDSTKVRVAANFRTLTNPNNTSQPPAGWSELANRGLIVSGSRIKLLPSGIEYTIAQTSDGQWHLTKDAAQGNSSYELTLEPAVLPNEEPRALPAGVTIDLDATRTAGKLPPTWYNSSSNAYGKLDVMFTPRGTVYGPTASTGMIQLLLTDRVDLDQNRGIGATDKEGKELLLTITTQTGNISTHPVYTSADPYRYAETGEVSK